MALGPTSPSRLFHHWLGVTAVNQKPGKVQRRVVLSHVSIRERPWTMVANLIDSEWECHQRVACAMKE